MMWWKLLKQRVLAKDFVFWSRSHKPSSYEKKIRSDYKLLGYQPISL